MTALKLFISKYWSRGFILLLLFFFTGCEKALDLKAPAFDQAAVFDEAWKVIDQHYALFPVKGVDWNNTYKEYRPQVTNSMTDIAFFRLISNMLETLKDGHVTLISPSDTSTYEGFFTAFATNFNYSNLTNNYLKNDFKTSGPAIYTIQNNVGYIYYGSFRNDITEAEVDKMMNEMKNTKGLIVDVRNNTGGKSANVDKLFQRFITEKKLVKYEQIKDGPGHNDFLEPDPYYLSPAISFYNHPVCVLTNRSCFSACNDFVLYMSGLANVTLVGDQTGGGGGIPHDFILANGWKIQYTATSTLSPEKLSIENGILPDVNIGISSIEETNGKDPILEKAYQLLQ